MIVLFTALTNMTLTPVAQAQRKQHFADLPERIPTRELIQHNTAAITPASLIKRKDGPTGIECLEIEQISDSPQILICDGWRYELDQGAEALVRAPHYRFTDDDLR